MDRLNYRQCMTLEEGVKFIGAEIWEYNPKRIITIIGVQINKKGLPLFILSGGCVGSLNFEQMFYQDTVNNKPIGVEKEE